MYHRQKTDLNQKQLVVELRQLGYTVIVVSHLLKFDLIVGKHGKNYLFEVKGKGKPLRPEQEEYHEWWQGQIHRIENTEETLEIMNV